MGSGANAAFNERQVMEFSRINLGIDAVVAALLVAGPLERMRANARRNEGLVIAAAAECTRLAGGAR